MERYVWWIVDALCVSKVTQSYLYCFHKQLLQIMKLSIISIINRLLVGLVTLSSFYITSYIKPCPYTTTYIKPCLHFISPVTLNPVLTPPLTLNLVLLFGSMTGAFFTSFNILPLKYDCPRRHRSGMFSVSIFVSSSTKRILCGDLLGLLKLSLWLTDGRRRSGLATSFCRSKSIDIY